MFKTIGKMRTNSISDYVMNLFDVEILPNLHHYLMFGALLLSVVLLFLKHNLRKSQQKTPSYYLFLKISLLFEKISNFYMLFFGALLLSVVLLFLIPSIGILCLIASLGCTIYQYFFLSQVSSKSNINTLLQ